MALSGCVYVRINKRCCLTSKSCISNRRSGGMETSCLHSRYAKRLKFSKLYLHPGHIMNDFWWGFQLSQEVKLEVCQASNPVRTYPRWGCSQCSAGPSAFYLRLCSYKQALCVLLLNGRQSLHCFFSLALCLLTSMHWGPTCVPSTVLGAVRNGAVFWAEFWCWSL